MHIYFIGNVLHEMYENFESNSEKWCQRVAMKTFGSYDHLTITSSGVSCSISSIDAKLSESEIKNIYPD